MVVVSNLKWQLKEWNLKKLPAKSDLNMHDNFLIYISGSTINLIFPHHSDYLVTYQITGCDCTSYHRAVFATPTNQ